MPFIAPIGALAKPCPGKPQHALPNRTSAHRAPPNGIILPLKAEVPNPILDNSTEPVNDKVLTDNGLMGRTWLDFLIWVKGRILQISSGPQQVAQADLAATGVFLGRGGGGTIVYVPVYDHHLRWTGAAWEFAPSDIGSRFYVDGFAAAPNSIGWAAADGGTKSYLKSDGTLGSQAVSNTANRWFRQ